MEFVFNDTITAQSDEIQMRAGTMVVIPSSIALDDDLRGPGEVASEIPLPDYLMLCAGQTLKREGYPGWSSEFDGGFYDFTLPNLINKFVVGFDADGKPIKGTGCIYFKDVPEIEAAPPRDVRQMTD